MMSVHRTLNKVFRFVVDLFLGAICVDSVVNDSKKETGDTRVKGTVNVECLALPQQADVQLFARIRLEACRNILTGKAANQHRDSIDC